MPLLTLQELYTRARERRIPISAKLDVTNTCNLSCVHCYRRPTDIKELTFKEIISVIDQMAKAGALFLSLSGGEPLMRKDFFDIAFYARKRGFALTIFTNATLVTEEAASKIAQLHPRMVHVSLYGASEDNYAKATGNPMAFHRAVRGIRLLAKKKIPMVIASTIFSFFSEKDVEWMKKFSERLGVEWDASLDFTVATDGDPSPLKCMPPKSQIEAMFKKFPVARRNKDTRNRAKLWACDTFRYNVYVNPYGNVGNCYMLTSKESIREKSMMNIWNNTPLLRKIGELKFTEFKKCLACKSLGYCHPCPAVHFMCSGKFSEPMAAVCETSHTMRECMEHVLRSELKK